jgi:choline transporter-like protein 2/4/5
VGWCGEYRYYSYLHDDCVVLTKAHQVLILFLPSYQSTTLPHACVVPINSLAVTVVKESGNVLGDICALVLFPVIPILITLGYLAFWLWVALYLYSVGSNQSVATPREVLFDTDGSKSLSLIFEITIILMVMCYNTIESLQNPPTMTIRKWDTSLKNLVFAHIFGLVWTFQFIVYCMFIIDMTCCTFQLLNHPLIVFLYISIVSYMVIAGTIADWYFSITDSEGNKKRGDGKGELSRHPILSAFKRTCRFHMGSLAFGSLIIAIIQTVRTILMYIQKKTSAKSNGLTRCMFACVACCLKCLQACIDKISKNAFVWTAIWGNHKTRLLPHLIINSQLHWYIHI